RYATSAPRRFPGSSCPPPVSRRGPDRESIAARKRATSSADGKCWSPASTRPPACARLPQPGRPSPTRAAPPQQAPCRRQRPRQSTPRPRSEEHTSELQSRGHLVCRLLLEKKNKIDEPSHTE